MSKNKGKKLEELAIKILRKNWTGSDIKRTINSGAIWFSKGDYYSDKYRIEIKGTEKNSFRLTNKVINKIWEEALDSNKLPLLLVLLVNKYKWLVVINIQKEPPGTLHNCGKKSLKIDETLIKYLYENNIKDSFFIKDKDKNYWFVTLNIIREAN